MNARMDDDLPLVENIELSASDADTALVILRQIRDSTISTTAEKVSAIKEIARISGGLDDGSGGPGGMTRAELQAELERVRALIAARMPG